MKSPHESAAPVSLGLSLSEAEALLLFMAEHKRIWTVVAKQCGVESPELLEERIGRRCDEGLSGEHVGSASAGLVRGSSMQPMPRRALLGKDRCKRHYRYAQEEAALNRARREDARL